MKALQSDDIYDENQSKPSKNQRKRKNRIMKQEFKELSNYLPYDVETTMGKITAIRTSEKEGIWIDTKQGELEHQFQLGYRDFKLLLRPLVFDKPIIHNGNRELPNEKITALLKEAYFEQNNIVISEINIEFIPIEQWVAVSDYLFSRHFDVYGKIAKGQAREL